MRTDWDQLDACKETLREHMALVRKRDGEIDRLRIALDKLPHRITPDEEDGEPDYYADGRNDCLDTMLAIRERK